MMWAILIEPSRVATAGGRWRRGALRAALLRLVEGLECLFPARSGDPPAPPPEWFKYPPF